MSDLHDEPAADPQPGHHPACDGHFDCPTCGVEVCGHTVVWALTEARPVLVVCLRCYGRFAVGEVTT